MSLGEDLRTEFQRQDDAGFTKEEGALWDSIGSVARRFHRLPMLHPEDWPEVAATIHVLQNKLLARPAYRRYLGDHALNDDGSANFWDVTHEGDSREASE